MAPRGGQSKAKNKRIAEKPSKLPSKEISSARISKVTVATFELEQLLLHIFKNSFPSRFNDSLPPLIQEVKKHLFNRDFDRAFGSNEYLEAYALRWSPSRALAYLHIFKDLAPYILDQPPAENPERSDLLVADAGPLSNSISPVMKVVCLGGGAGAELVALAGFLHHLSLSPDTLPGSEQAHHMTVELIDIADWSSILQELIHGLTSVPPVSKYASPAAAAAALPLVPASCYKMASHKQDMLDYSPERLSLLVKGTRLLTLMFTLNELYSTSISGTTKFLLTLGEVSEKGMLLLVVDSPGSYSTVKVGGPKEAKETLAGVEQGEKRYPMNWLLEHTLLKLSCSGNDTGQVSKWGKLVSEESRWYRLPQSLKYPIELENMRYQIHLYRRL
ncbi:MAG: hypothetical protein M1829_004104 [Trizodia sp. TS-e1964]|nr:MAG: hypothetical protein M1829_004104 [Trizodia sp. TS-e1964]